MKNAERELSTLERRVDRLERDVGDRHTGLAAQRERVEALEATLARVARVLATPPTGDLQDFVALLAAALATPPKPVPRPGSAAERASQPTANRGEPSKGA